MVKNIHKVGEEETSEVAEVGEMVIHAEVQCNQARNSPFIMIGSVLCLSR